MSTHFDMPLNTSAATTYVRPITCPYCGVHFAITLPPAYNTRFKIQGPEIAVLPYARDIDKFDPPSRQPNSPWTQVGKDFFATFRYDRFLGILQLPPGLLVYYCVARCPECGPRRDARAGTRGLIDVFANLTHQKKSLSEIWPHLFRSAPSDSYSPSRFLSPRSPFSVLVVLVLAYLGSFSVDIIYCLHRSPCHLDYFPDTHRANLLIKGILIVSLFFLIWLRTSLIQLFAMNKERFAALFMLKNEHDLAYWLNFAVSRFTGYRHKGITINAVVIFGGLSSTILLIAAWVLARIGVLATHAYQNSYEIVADVIFWLIASFVFGVMLWNFLLIPNYILRGIDRIPMKAGEISEFGEDFKIIERIGIYFGLGIFIVATVSILFTVFSIQGIGELQWVIVWQQSVLILFYALIIMMFASTRHMGNKVVVILIIVVTYVVLRVWIGMSQADSGVVEIIGLKIGTSIAQYAELAIVSVLTIYLFYTINVITCKNIKRKYVNELLAPYKKLAKRYAEELKTAGRPDNIKESLESYGMVLDVIRYIEDRAVKGMLTQKMVSIIGAIILSLLSALGNALIKHLV